MTDQYEGERVDLNLPPIHLVHPETERAVRALCWALAIILWLWLLLGAATVIAFILGVVNT